MTEKIRCKYETLLELHKIVVNPRNSNNHPQKQVEMLAKIIDHLGQRHPLIISKRSGYLVAGHGRLLALQKLGWDKCAVEYQEFDSEAEEFSFLIADNKIAELSEHDDVKMLEGIKDLDLFDIDFELLGLCNFEMPIIDLPDEMDDILKDDMNKKFIIEVQFPNDMEMQDIFDDLTSRGYLVKIK